MFELHPQLQRDCFGIGRFELCRLLLMNDRQYPWFILVPERAGVREIYQLTDSEQMLLWRESAVLARGLAQEFQADKLNIAAIGNSVPQLHVHHIVRYQTDATWPAPVWGQLPPLAYDEVGLEAVINRLQNCLPSAFLWSIA